MKSRRTGKANRESALSKSAAYRGAALGAYVSKSSARTAARRAAVYMGPSVEGSDAEYVKVISGEVNRSKPSFA